MTDKPLSQIVRESDVPVKVVCINNKHEYYVWAKNELVFRFCAVSKTGRRNDVAFDAAEIDTYYSLPKEPEKIKGWVPVFVNDEKNKELYRTGGLPNPSAEAVFSLHRNCVNFIGVIHIDTEIIKE